MAKNIENTQTPVKNVKEELANLESQRASIAKELTSVKKLGGVDEFQRLNLEDKLVGLETECEEVRECLKRLREDIKTCSEREQTTAARNAKLSADFKKMVCEKNRIISELREENNEMKNQMKEKDRICEEHEQKIACCEKRIREMDDEVNDWKCKKLAADNMIEEMKLKQLESDRSMEKVCPSNLVSRIATLELELANFFNVNVDDLRHVVDEPVAAVENDKVSIPSSKVEMLKSDLRLPEVQSDLAKRDIIEINDDSDDDETNPIRAAPKRKRNVDHFHNCGSPIYPNIKEESVKSTGLDDSDNESCSELCINELLERLKRRRTQRTPNLISKTWMFGTDLLKAFEEDDNLCMNAVCMLYRHISSSNPPENLYHFEAMSGHSMAEYLIDGDSNLRLKKSILEVKRERPNIIEQCRRLAIAYHETVFSIYCMRSDSIFKSS